jgi:hypothetical protein
MDTTVNEECFLEACHPATSPQRLRELALHPSPAIRARVAENIHTPADILEVLSHDASAEVRTSVTLNRSTPLVVFWILATDHCPDVRFAIAENPHTVVEILIWLSADDNPYVALRAEKTVESVRFGGSKHQGGQEMSLTNVERTLRRALNKKERLNKADATRLKHMVLSDGYLSRGERRVMVQAMEDDLLNDDAFEIFLEVLLQKHNGLRARRQIA